jgi:ribosomal protein L32E
LLLLVVGGDDSYGRQGSKESPALGERWRKRGVGLGKMRHRCKSSLPS